MSFYIVSILNIISLRTKDLKNEIIMKAFGTLYEDYKIKHKYRHRLTHFYNIIFLFRRLFYAGILVYMFYYPVYQQIANVAIHFVLCLINLAQRPFAQNLYGYMVSLLDIFTFLCFLTVACFLMEEMPENTKLLIGKIMIISITIVICICWLVCCFMLLRSLFLWIKCKVKERKENAGKIRINKIRNRKIKNIQTRFIKKQISQNNNVTKKYDLKKKNNVKKIIRKPSIQNDYASYDISD